MELQHMHHNLGKSIENELIVWNISNIQQNINNWKFNITQFCFYKVDSSSQKILCYIYLSLLLSAVILLKKVIWQTDIYYRLYLKPEFIETIKK